MRLLQLLRADHESRSLDRRIKRLLERVETKPCSDEKFSEILFNLQSSIETAKYFNEKNSHTSPDYRIPVRDYETRLNLAKESGACFSSCDGWYI